MRIITLACPPSFFAAFCDRFADQISQCIETTPLCNGAAMSPGQRRQHRNKHPGRADARCRNEGNQGIVGQIERNGFYSIHYRSNEHNGQPNGNSPKYSSGILLPFCSVLIDVFALGNENVFLSQKRQCRCLFRCQFCQLGALIRGEGTLLSQIIRRRLTFFSHAAFFLFSRASALSWIKCRFITSLPIMLPYEEASPSSRTLLQGEPLACVSRIRSMAVFFP